MWMSVPQIAVLRDLDQHVVGADLGLRHVAPARCRARASALTSAFMRCCLDSDDAQLAADRRRTRRPRGRVCSRRVRGATSACGCAPGPCGTTGKEKPIDVDALARAAASAICCASVASPSITGMIGCSPGTSLKPGCVMPRAEVLRVARAAARAARRRRSSRSSTVERRARRSPAAACWRTGRAASAGAASRRPRLRAEV